jgi:hypothetical protein
LFIKGGLMKSALRALILVLLALLAGSAEAQQRQTGPYLTVSPTPSKLSGMGAGFVQQDANGIAFVAQGAPGSGTVTNTAGALTLGSMVVGNGSADIKVVGGTIGGAFTTAGPVTFVNGSIGVTLQFPANGPFNYVFPPASQTLASLAGAETFTNKIYNGGQLSGTFSGNPAFSGVPSFTGLSPGVQTRCLGLDVGNNLVTLNAGCGSGGGGSTWTLTDGSNTVAGVTQVTVTGGTVGGSTPNATLTIAGGGTVTRNGNLATNQIVTGGTNGTSDVKTVTTGVNVLTALSANVGSAGAFAKNNGDALSGTYTGAPTFSGNLIFSGVPKFTGLSGGTAVGCLALDGVNSVIAITCTGGGSGTVNTGGANQLAYYASLGNAVSGFGPLTNGQLPCGSTGAAPVPCVPTAGTPNLVVGTSAGGLSISSTSPINDISGSGTAIVTGDNTKIDKVGAFTYTLAQAGTTGFGNGWGVCLLNVGAGNATINATTSTFVGAGGSTSLVLAPGAWACPTSDGTNYQTSQGNNLVAGSGITITRNANGTISIASSASAAFTVDTNAALVALTPSTGAQVIRLGFTARGDAEPLLYRGTGSACSAADNGAQVTGAGGNCWIAMFTGTNRNVDEWGADPTGSADSRAAIMAAITASYSATTCNVLWFTGKYKISGTTGLILGNGSSSAASTLGCTPVLSGTSTPLSWINGTEPAPAAPAIFSTTVAGAMIQVKGPLTTWGIQNLKIDCTGNAALPAGLQVISASYGDSKNLSFTACMQGVVSQTVSAIPSGLLNADAISNNYKHIHIHTADANNAAGFLLLGDGNASPLSDTDMNHIEDVIFAPGCTGGNLCYPIYMLVSDNNLIENWTSTGGATAANIIITLDYTVNTGFPNSTTFMHIDNANYSWNNIGAPAGGTATNNIIGLLKGNGSTNPALAGLACTAC